MKRSQLKDVSMEIMVGAFIFMILLALGFFTIILSYENIFSESYSLSVRFEHVRGLRQGDNVFWRGVMIGRIVDMEVDEEGVVITASLRKPVQMREGYRVEIVASSVLGGQHLSLDEGPLNAPPIPEGTVLVGQRPADIMAEATAVVASVREQLEEGEVLQNLSKIMSDLAVVTDWVSQGEGTIGALFQSDAVYTNLLALSENVNLITAEIRSGEGTLGALIYDDALYSHVLEIVEGVRSGEGLIGQLLVEDSQLGGDLVATMAAIRSVVEQINSGQGTLGRLIAEDELYEEARLMLHEVRAAVDDFRETAPITTFSSIFFGAF